MQNNNTIAFHHAASRIVRNKKKAKSSGARRLSHCRNELASATIMGLKDKEILSCFRKLGDENPLAGLSNSTAIQYIAMARTEFGYYKNAPRS
jgi:hypothetical protein